MKAKNKTVVDYWAHFYLERHLCSLCGNSGIVDTTGVKTAAGVVVGRRNFCICPNGQAIRHQDPNALGLPPLPSQER